MAFWEMLQSIMGYGYPPVDRQIDGWTDACQNITFPRTTYAGGNKPIDVMDNSGILGFLECVFWENQFFLWTLSVSSTYNIVTMTVER